MMILTAKLTRKKAALAVILMGLCIGVVVLTVGLLQARRAGDSAPTEEPLLNNADRVAYLEAYGWQVSPEPVETLRLRLPEALEDSWADYNALQLQQGLDLAPWQGEKAERFTYTVTNYPGAATGIQANLYLCGGTVVAGDIFCAGEDGFQATLTYPDETQEAS